MRRKTQSKWEVCNVHISWKRKKVHLKIAFTTDNTIGIILSTQHKQVQYKQDKCGIDQLTCPTCKMKYRDRQADPSELDFKSTFEILNKAITRKQIQHNIHKPTTHSEYQTGNSATTPTENTVQQTNDNIVSTKKTTSNTNLLPPRDNTEEQGHTRTRTQATDHANPYATQPI